MVEGFEGRVKRRKKGVPLGDGFLLQQLRNKAWQPISLMTPLAIQQLPTPALVLNRSVMERNLTAMAAHMGGHGKKTRPHAKTHKCAIIARIQLDHGAVGLCVAKLGEAAALVLAGIGNVLITSPIVSPGKIIVLGQLTAMAEELLLVVDSWFGMQMLLDHFPQDGRLGLVLDIDVDMGRTGCRDADAARRILDAIEGDRRFHLAGIQHYAGHLMHLSSFAERTERSLTSWGHALEFARRVCGELPPIVTGGGSGTYAIDVNVAEITDMQVGSYLFMDREYMDIQSVTGENFLEFEPSLTVACTAISAPLQQLGAVTVNGGFKAFAADSGVPVIHEGPAGKFRFAGDEHGVFRVSNGAAPSLGSVLRFVVPHCDPTVNLHDVYWVQEADGLVHTVWPITARGAVW